MSLKRKCSNCKEDFLIIEQEEAFYREKDFPLPTECPKCRFKRRMLTRHEREFYAYNCDKCKKDILVAFKPPKGQQIYCKECFQKYMQENDCILGYSEAARKELNQENDKK